VLLGAFMGLLSSLPHRGPDIGLFVVALLIFGAGAAMLGNAMMNFARPPMLMLEGHGLTYNTYRRERYWTWQAIEALSLSKGRGACVSFSWNEKVNEGAVRRRIALESPFQGILANPKSLYELLVTAQTEALGAPQLTPSTQWKVKRGKSIWGKKYLKIGAFGFFALHLVALVDLNTAKSALIAPTNPLFISCMEWIAGIISLVMVSLIPRGIEAISPEPMPKSKKVTLWILLGLTFPILSGFAFSHLAWRAEELIAFAGTEAPIRSAKLSIKRLSSGKGSFTATAIGPEGDYTFLPISRRDYERFRDSYLSERQLCYTVQMQEQANAVRIIRPNRPSGDELRLFDC
jgi:hypothetical protein